MRYDPRDSIKIEKRMPLTLEGDAGKVLAVNPEMDSYVHVNPTGSPLTGTIIMWPSIVPPVGYLLCNGALVAVAEYPELFAILGYTFGGSGDYFALPSAGDKYPAGPSEVNPVGTYLDAEVGTHTHIEADEEGTHLHEATTEGGGLHSHSITVAAVGNHTHPSGASGVAGDSAKHADGSHYCADNGSNTGSGGAHTHSATAGTAPDHTHTVNITGGGTHKHTILAHEGVNIPATFVISFCIKT